MSVPTFARDPRSSRRLPLPLPVTQVIGRVVGSAGFCVGALPGIGAGLLGLARAHAVPATISVYAAWKLLQLVKSRVKGSGGDAQPVATPSMFEGLTAEAAAEELQKLRLVMLECLVEKLLADMVDDTLAVTLSLPLSDMPVESIREEIQLHTDTLNALYGKPAMDALLQKLEKEKKWAKVVTEATGLIDAGNPRLNFTQPKKMQDAKQWPTVLSNI